MGTIVALMLAGLLLLILCVSGVAYILGLWAGREDQHSREMDALCHQGEDTFDVVDSHDNLWKVTVHAICMRRGDRKL